MTKRCLFVDAGFVRLQGQHVNPQQFAAQLAARRAAEQQVLEQAEREQERRRQQWDAMQRGKQRRAVERMLAEEDEMQYIEYDGSECDGSEASASVAQPSSGRSGQQGTRGGTAGEHARPARTHGERQQQAAKHWQAHIEQGVQYDIMLSPRHAAAEVEDLWQQLAARQRRVDEYVAGGALHPGCSGRCAEVGQRRPVLHRCLWGTGVLHIPKLRWVQTGCCGLHMGKGPA